MPDKPRLHPATLKLKRKMMISENLVKAYKLLEGVSERIHEIAQHGKVIWQFDEQQADAIHHHTIRSSSEKLTEAMQLLKDEIVEAVLKG